MPARLQGIEDVRIIGASPSRVSVLSFCIEGMEPTQVEKRLDQEAGIAVRGGSLSAQPLMKFLGLPGAVRASFMFYNTREEADALVDAVQRLAASR
jgi:cysteine desulfurase / selenocysteine lyase